jgi:trk system potassium uptake protein TrkH
MRWCGHDHFPDRRYSDDGLFFEAASAIGTVGCTMGITPHLCAVSHILLILLMYFGRVGGLTLAYAVASKSRFVKSMPEERISVG